MGILELYNTAKTEGISAFDIKSTQQTFIGCDFVPLAENCYNIMTGAGGSGKSYIALQILVRQAVKGKKCLAWSTEDEGGVTKHRLKTICEKVLNYSETQTNEAMRNIDILDSKYVYRFVKKIKGDAVLTDIDKFEFQQIMLDYDVALLDPLKAFHSADENENSHMDFLVRDLFQATAQKCKTTLLVIHHTAKSNSEDRMASRGANTIVESARLGLEVIPFMVKTEQNGRTLYVKDKDRKDSLQVLPRKDNHNASRFFTHGFTFTAFPKSDNHAPIAEVEFKSEKETKVLVSISKDMTKDYKVKEIPFSKLVDLVRSDYNYSCQLFKDGYRDLEHYVSGSNLIGLDIDDGLTIEEAKKVFAPYKCIIATTKSHQKDKNGIVCDRFRVLMPTDNITLNAEDFKLMMMEVHREFNFVDKQCSNVSRFYYASKDSSVIEIQGNRLFDWNKYYQKAKARKEIEKAQQIQKAQMLTQTFSKSTEQDILDALEFIPCDCDYEQWLNIGMALHQELQESGFYLWNSWSAKGSKYDGEEMLRKKWETFGKRSDIGIATLFHYAKMNGYTKVSIPEVA